MIKYTNKSFTPFVFLGSEEIEKAVTAKDLAKSARLLAEAKVVAVAAARAAKLAAGRVKPVQVVKVARLPAGGPVPLPGKGADLAPKNRPAKARKKAELLLDTLDVKRPEKEGSEYWYKLRLQCRETGLLLADRGKIAKPLYKAAQKIKNCSLWGVFHAVAPGQNYKIGTALCKSRFCPNCQKVVAVKRKSNFINWFELNRAPLAKYFFYHMVLTVRHSAATGLRDNLYTSDLIESFAQLRGTSRQLGGTDKRAWSNDWRHFVAGGTYSVELKPGSDSSPHIHIHCLLISKVKLYNKAQDSEFMKVMLPRWRAITGETDANARPIFIEPVYNINSETKAKEYAFKGSEARVDSAVAECMKYTLKADAASLGGYSDAFLVELLTLKNRYYSRFGCLNPKDKTSAQFSELAMLCTDYKDLEQMDREELRRLFDAETGEIIPIEKTRLLCTPMRNMKARDNVARAPRDAAGNLLEIARGGITPTDATLYSIVLPPGANGGQLLWFAPNDRAGAALVLARTISNDYDETLDTSFTLVP